MAASQASLIHSFILKIYMAPLQDIYSRRSLVNQSMKLDIAPLQDIYSEALTSKTAVSNRCVNTPKRHVTSCDVIMNENVTSASGTSLLLIDAIHQQVK